MRTFTEDDLAPLAAIQGDQEVMRFFGGPRDQEQVRAGLLRAIAQYEAVGFGKWAVVLRSTAQLIGRCGPSPEDIEGTNEVEVGYLLARGHWGQGLATEATRAAIDHCFAALGLQRVVSIVHPLNLPSRRLAQRVGMTDERAVQWRGMNMRLFSRSRREEPRCP
jgi:RimJ/RimL family protein N-acetyltransferase